MRAVIPLCRLLVSGYFESQSAGLYQERVESYDNAAIGECQSMESSFPVRDRGIVKEETEYIA